MGDGPLDDGNARLIGDQMNLTFGSEIVTNGSFAGVPDGTDPVGNIAGWSAYGTPTTREIENERLKVVANASAQGAYIELTTVVGEVYLFSCDFVDSDGNPTPAASLGNLYSNVFSNVANTVDGKTSRVFVATSTSTLIFVRSYGAAQTFYTDNFSLKKLNGYAGTMKNMTADDIVADTP